MSSPRSSQVKSEHHRALEMLNDILSVNSFPTARVAKPYFEEGSIQILPHNYSTKQLPSTPSWRWNQTKGKREAFLPLHQANVTLTKLIPRRRANTLTKIPIPAYKLWLFGVKFNLRSITVIWCEKGEKKEGNASPSPDLSPSQSISSRMVSEIDELWDPLSLEVHPQVAHKPLVNPALQLSFICN